VVYTAVDSVTTSEHRRKMTDFLWMHHQCYTPTTQKSWDLFLSFIIIIILKSIH